MTEILTFLAIAVPVAAWLRWRDRRRFDEMVGKTVEELEIEARHRLPKIIAFSAITGLTVLCGTITANHLVSTLGSEGISSLAAEFRGRSPTTRRPGGRSGEAGNGGGTDRVVVDLSQVTVPNTPSILTLTVVDTSTVWVEGSAFSGTGGDSFDSIHVAITRVAQDTTNILSDTKGGPQVRDTVVDNANLKNDTIYTAYLKYRGEEGGWSAWSAPDTFTNNLPSFPAGTQLITDWSTATGTSANALADSNAAVPWPTIANSGGTIEIVNASSEGLTSWPMTNAMRVRLDQQLRNDKVRITQADNLLAQLDSGEWRGYRWYFWATVPDGAGYGDSQHIVEQNIGGYGTDTNWVWIHVYNAQNVSHAAGEWSAHWAQQVPGNPPYPYRQLRSPKLQKDSTYVFQLVHQQVTSTDYRMLMRIYAPDGTLLHDYDDHCYMDCNGGAFKPDTLYSVADIAQTKELQVGSNEGPSGGSYPFTFYYYGAYAVWDGTGVDIADIEWFPVPWTSDETNWAGPS